jgi:hypothetical protein
MKFGPAFVTLIVLASLAALSASADIGPKPTVDIDVAYEGAEIPDASFSARMLACVRGVETTFPERSPVHQLRISEYDPAKNCSWRPAAFAWGGDCSASACHFNYHPPAQFKLAVYLPGLDKVFISDEISRTNFYSNYRAELAPDGSVRIRETTPFFRKDIISAFVKALVITLVLETLVALIFLSLARLPKRILRSVLLANAVSLPIVWFLFPLVLRTPSVILFAEIFAIAFEACFIRLLDRDAIAFRKAVSLSVMMNLASLVAGGFLFLLISYMS